MHGYDLPPPSMGGPPPGGVGGTGGPHPGSLLGAGGPPPPPDSMTHPDSTDGYRTPFEIKPLLEEFAAPHTNTMLPEDLSVKHEEETVERVPFLTPFGPRPRNSKYAKQKKVAPRGLQGSSEAPWGVESQAALLRACWSNLMGMNFGANI
ncbi:hypothetical protein HUJ04_004904 [Dendroctonus ponderosae]|nr:hypothetical protein HUJ04_004904 [Dendroctonus ponderosae]